MALQTTFEVFKQLLSESIDDASDLSSVMKVALKERVDALPRVQLAILSSDNVLSVVNAVVSEADGSITVEDGDAGQVTFSLFEFDTPVRIDGTVGTIGALVGHIGQGTNPVVANADMTLSYRLGTTGAFKTFTRSTVLDPVSEIQFRLDVATQTGDHDVPLLYLVTEQL